MPKIQLIALDLDGTTLNNHHELTEKTIATLSHFSQGGITVAIVTGRSKASAIDYVESLKLSVPVPLICYNGSMGVVFDGKTEEKVFSMPIPESSARVLLNLAKKLGLVAQVRRMCYSCWTKGLLLSRLRDIFLSALHPMSNKCSTYI